MTFQELLDQARSRGYIAVYNGVTTVPIDKFMLDHKYDYALNDNGAITYFDAGFEWFYNLRFVHVSVV